MIGSVLPHWKFEREGTFDIAFGNGNDVLVRVNKAICTKYLHIKFAAGLGAHFGRPSLDDFGDVVRRRQLVRTTHLGDSSGRNRSDRHCSQC